MMLMPAAVEHTIPFAAVITKQQRRANSTPTAWARKGAGVRQTASTEPRKPFVVL